MIFSISRIIACMVNTNILLPFGVMVFVSSLRIRRPEREGECPEREQDGHGQRCFLLATIAVRALNVTFRQF